MRKAALILAALSRLRTSPPTGAHKLSRISGLQPETAATAQPFSRTVLKEESRISTLCTFFMRHPQYVSRSGRVCSTPKALYPR